MTTPSLNRIEKEIIRIVLKENRPLSINSISKITGISWITVRKYIPLLLKKGVIDEIKEEKK